jgi:hypothetical protein
MASVTGTLGYGADAVLGLLREVLELPDVFLAKSRGLGRAAALLWASRACGSDGSVR